MKYKVTYIQEWGYEVDAEDEYEAENIANQLFSDEMRKPIAHLHTDDVIIEELEEEETP